MSTCAFKNKCLFGKHKRSLKGQYIVTINRAWNRCSSFRSYYRCFCINEPIIFSHCVHLKLGHRFHALLKGRRYAMKWILVTWQSLLTFNYNAIQWVFSMLRLSLGWFICGDIANMNTTSWRRVWVHKRGTCLKTNCNNQMNYGTTMIHHNTTMIHHNTTMIHHSTTMIHHNTTMIHHKGNMV